MFQKLPRSLYSVITIFSLGGRCKKPFANINHVLVTKTHSHEFHSESSLCFHHVI